MNTLTSPSQQAQLADYIARAKSKLEPEVEHLAYRIREASSGEPGIFFRITLVDSATAEDVISEVSGRVVLSLLEEVGPIENWGLRSYFNFRSYSSLLQWCRQCRNVKLSEQGLNLHVNP